MVRTTQLKGMNKCRDNRIKILENIHRIIRKISEGDPEKARNIC